MELTIAIILGFNFLLGIYNFLDTKGDIQINIYSTAVLVIVTWSILPLAIVILSIWFIQAIIFMALKDDLI